MYGVCGVYGECYMTRGQHLFKIPTLSSLPPKFIRMFGREESQSLNVRNWREKALLFNISTPLLIKREPNLFPGIIYHPSIPMILLVSNPRKRFHVSKKRQSGGNRTYSNNNLKNQTSKSSFLSTLFAQSLPALAILCASSTPPFSLSWAKNLTLSNHSSPCRLKGT